MGVRYLDERARAARGRGARLLDGPRRDARVGDRRHAHDAVDHRRGRGAGIGDPLVDGGLAAGRGNGDLLRLARRPAPERRLPEQRRAVHGDELRRRTAAGGHAHVHRDRALAHLDGAQRTEDGRGSVGRCDALRAGSRERRPNGGRSGQPDGGREGCEQQHGRQLQRRTHPRLRRLERGARTGSCRLSPTKPEPRSRWARRPPSSSSAGRRW